MRISPFCFVLARSIGIETLIIMFELCVIISMGTFASGLLTSGAGRMIFSGGNIFSRTLSATEKRFISLYIGLTVIESIDSAGRHEPLCTFQSFANDATILGYEAVKT